MAVEAREVGAALGSGVAIRAMVQQCFNNRNLIGRGFLCIADPGERNV